MHKIPGFWRFHRVHHSDPAVDVTTTIRQHPGENVIRYAFLTVAACALGASPGAFAVYRAASVLGGLLEHANIRVPLWLSRLLSLVTSWPYMHKVHHSRLATQTDTNYSNLFSIWDRLFATFTPAREVRTSPTGSRLRRPGRADHGRAARAALPDRAARQPFAVGRRDTLPRSEAESCPSFP
jgi:sterol desaturase/sphingolipid hydroxylase (fatty acid hydroxylase superfamily)